MATPRGTDRQRLAAIGVGLAAVCFVALNTFGSLGLRPYRLDLTENRQFTLSGGTRGLLAGVEEPVTLRLYVSRAVREANPFLATYADRVRDTLEAYARASDGRIAVELVDPEPFSPEEDRAVGFGLEPLALDNRGSTGYFGLAGTNSTDDVDVIPVLSPERETFLEYDLTRMVFNLANPDKPVVAVLSSLPLNGDPALNYQPWQVATELGQFFELRHLGGEVARIEDDVRALLLVHPQELSERTLYAVDQFVMRGGEALVFVDPHSEAQAIRQQQRQQQGGPPQETASDLPRLFEAWGVELAAGKVVADPSAARQVTFPSGGRNQVVDYLPWLALDRRNLARGEVIAAELNQINLGTAGVLKARAGATTAFAPLLSSSAEAMQVEADRVRVYPDPFALIRDFEAGNEPLAMAARLSGPARSAFPAKPEAATDGPDYLAEAREPLNVVVVADTDLLDDRNWLAGQGGFGQNVQVPVADNAGLVANALDYLAGSDALLDLRGREVTFRPFTRVAEIRREAEARYRAKEQELVQKLGDLQQKLGAARPTSAEGGEEGALLSQGQREEVEGFRGQLLDTRRELREVQLALRQDIDGLQDRVRFLGIAAVPILVALAAVAVALLKRARYRRRVAADTAAATAAA